MLPVHRTGRWGLRDYGVDGQLGLEETPEEYIAKMVAVFREVRRVLRDDGTLWLNLGDSYSGGSGGYDEKWDDSKWSVGAAPNRIKSVSCKTLPPKNLVGIPWRVALALQADGWYLRQDIIWHKPNAMPESVTDRCTKAHEYIFLMTKKPRYYYDAEAIKVPLAESTANDKRQLKGEFTDRRPERGFVGNPSQGSGLLKSNGGTANKRSVWTVPTAPYSEAHFATFPPKLIEPCILAGCPQWVCKKCGEPRRRITETTQIKRRRNTPTTKPCDDRSPSANDVAGTESKTVGWADCGCGEGFDGGIVLDPFGGAFTTALVAYRNNRHYTIIELSKEYVELGKARLAAEKSQYKLFENNPCTMPDPMVSLKETHLFKEPAQ